MKTKWKHLKIALLVNLFIFFLLWWILANVFILGKQQDFYALAISLVIYLLMSFNDATVFHLQDRIEELEKREKFNNKYKLL